MVGENQSSWRMGVSEPLRLWPSRCAAPRQTDVRSLPKRLSAWICIPRLAPSRCWWTLRVGRIYILVNPNRCMWNKAWQVNSLLLTPLCLEGQLSRKWTTDSGSVHQITTSSVCVQHCYEPEANAGTITLITALPGAVGVCAYMCVTQAQYRLKAES